MIQNCNPQRTLAFFGVVLVLALTAGCSKNGSAGKGEVLAKVNNYKVMSSEVDKAFNAQVTGSPQKFTATEEEALRLQILSQIIDRQLLLQRAEKVGVAATDDEVQSKFNQAEAPYTREEFQKQLKNSGFNSEEEYKLDLRRNLTVEKLLNREVASKVIVTDADIANYYDQNKTEFNLVEPLYHLATIFVSNQPAARSGNSSDHAQFELQAKRKITMILARLNSGDDFPDLAQKYSDDQDTARSGGFMPPMPESQIKNLDSMTRNAVQKLKPGQYTDVLPAINPQTRQPGGYRIIRLVGTDIAGQREMNDPNVQQFIRNQLRTEKEKILRAAFDEVVRENAAVHNYYAEKILEDFGAQK